MRDRSGSDLFGEFFGDFPDRVRGDFWQPDVDVFETEDGLQVRVELAGVPSSDLRVTVDANVLRISGERAPSSAAEVTRLHQMEIASGPFERRIALPASVDRERVSARLADGVLSVTLRKRQPQHTKVEVEGEASKALSVDDE